MRDKPWAVIDLLDETAPTQWFATRTEAEDAAGGSGFDIQYRPGRKPKAKSKST